MSEPRPGTNARLLALMEENPHEAAVIRKAYMIGKREVRE